MPLPVSIRVFLPKSADPNRVSRGGEDGSDTAYEPVERSRGGDVTDTIATCLRGRSGAEAGVAVGAARNGTRSEGGCATKRDGGCTTRAFHFSLFLFGFFVLSRPTRAAPAERGKTGATPPFRRWRGSALGECTTWCNTRCNTFPPRQAGSLPSEIIHSWKAQTPAHGRERTRRRAAR